MHTPTVPDEFVRARLVTAWRVSPSLRLAANYAGLSPEIVEAWIVRGQGETSGPYFELAKDYQRIVAELEIRLAANVHKATQPRKVEKIRRKVQGGVEVERIIEEYEEAGDVASSKWLLERSFSERWSPKQQVNEGATTVKAYVGINVEDV
jgi:hypothetical protein